MPQRSMIAVEKDGIQRVTIRVWVGQSVNARAGAKARARTGAGARARARARDRDRDRDRDRTRCLEQLNVYRNHVFMIRTELVESLPTRIAAQLGWKPAISREGQVACISTERCRTTRRYLIRW